jgi:hypothetical protein
MDIFTIFLLTPLVAMGCPLFLAFILSIASAICLLTLVIANIWWILPLYLICQVVF